MVVSEGTLRTEDLITAFLAELKARDVATAEALIKAYQDEVTHVETGTKNPPNNWETREMLGYFLDDLFDALDECAPEGTYFGAHEGDGACFGFWQIEEDVEGENDE